MDKALGIAVKLGVVAVLLLPIYPAAYFGPHYWAELKMAEVAQVSVLTWRDRSLNRAVANVPAAMDQRSIPAYIVPEDCTFEEVGDAKEVICEWTVRVKHPLSSEGTEMSFFAAKGLDGSGALYDLE